MAELERIVADYYATQGADILGLDGFFEGVGHHFESDALGGEVEGT